MAQVHTMNWTNPTTNTDGSAFDPTTTAGYTIQFDGVGAVSVPMGLATTFDMSTLAVWPTLKSGNHTVALDIVTKSGVSSAFSSAATFPILPVPTAPISVVVV